jgi:hypothetical protein
MKMLRRLTCAAFLSMTWAGGLQAVEPIQDPETKSTFIVERDGQRISSIHVSGNALWHLDVAKISRKGDPAVKVASVGLPTMAMVSGVEEQERYLLVRLSTKEFGLVHKLTARFIFLGPK